MAVIASSTPTGGRCGTRDDTGRDFPVSVKTFYTVHPGCMRPFAGKSRPNKRGSGKTDPAIAA